MSLVRTSDGIRLHVEETGSGEALLFAHEFGGDWRSWHPQVAHFGERYRCIRYCARGFLPSDVPEDASAYGQGRSTRDLLDLVTAKALPRFHLVGLSMGSFTALDFALRHAGRLRSLTLAGCSSGPTGAAERARYRERLSAEIDLLDRCGGDGAVGWFAQDPAYRRMPERQPGMWERYCTNLRAQSVTGARNTLATLHWNRPSLYARERELAGLTVPTLLIFGAEDHPLVEPTNHFLVSRLPHATMVQLPDTGHLVNLEQPAAFNAALERHLLAAAG